MGIAKQNIEILPYFFFYVWLIKIISLIKRNTEIKTKVDYFYFSSSKLAECQTIFPVHRLSLSSCVVVTHVCTILFPAVIFNKRYIVSL